MKITILTYGSAGDVVPYISLALGLMDRHHEVILAAPQNFESLVTGYGIRYMPLHGSSQALLDTEEGMGFACFSLGSLEDRCKTCSTSGAR